MTGLRVKRYRVAVKGNLVTAGRSTSDRDENAPSCHRSAPVPTITSRNIKAKQDKAGRSTSARKENAPNATRTSPNVAPTEAVI